MKVDQRPEGEDEDESWKKNAIPARFCHLWVAIPFQTWTCFQTFPNNSKDPARTCARTLGRHRVIEKGKPGQRRGHGYPNLECLWNMDAAAAWLEYMKKRYLIKSFNDQIAGCQLQTLSLFCGTLGESSKLNLTLCCQKKQDQPLRSTKKSKSTGVKSATWSKISGIMTLGQYGWQVQAQCSSIKMHSHEKKAPKFRKDSQKPRIH